jgi:hypothetical protein
MLSCTLLDNTVNSVFEGAFIDGILEAVVA